MSDIDIALLKQEINSAFPEHPIPAPPALKYFPTEEWEYKSAENLLAGKVWNMVDLNGLATEGKTINRLRPEAFKYYLPAYMMAFIENPEFPEGDMYQIPSSSPSQISCSLISEIAMGDKFGAPNETIKFQLLTSDQRIVVKKFIQYSANTIFRTSGMLESAIAELGKA